MSRKIRFNWALSGRLREITCTYGDDRLVKGLVELTVWVSAIWGWRPRQWRIGPQRRRFEFESLLLTVNGKPQIVTSFFFIEKSRRQAEVPHIPGAWWVNPHQRCHWATWDGDDRAAALRDAFASLRFVLQRRSPWALEVDHRFAKGASEHEFAPAERDAMIQLLTPLIKVIESEYDFGEIYLRWDGPDGESATGYEDWQEKWVSAKLHPLCRQVSISGPEADPLFRLGQDSTRSKSFAVGAWLGATEHLLRQHSA